MSHFYTKHHLFTKTGSGQTKEKLRKKGVAQKLAIDSGLPLMVHHNWSSIPLEQSPGKENACLFAPFYVYFVFLRHFILKIIMSPRQVRDKHGESAKTKTRSLITGEMQPGDLYTHCYNASNVTIVEGGKKTFPNCFSTFPTLVPSLSW